MNFFSHLLALIIILAVMMKLLSSNKDFMNRLRSVERPRTYSYSREPARFSHSERSFLGVLERAIGSEYRVFGKVRIADLLKPENGIGRQAALNRITGKHVDFVVCKASDLSIVGVIELDDSSHHQHSRQKRDAFVDNAFASAGVPIARFPARAAYTLPTVREAIQQRLNITILESKPAPPKQPVIPTKVTSLCDFNEPSDRQRPDAKS